MVITDLFLELTNICNFACSYCPSKLLKRPRGYINLEQVKKIISELGDYQSNIKVHLWLMGESCYHTNLVDICKMLHKRNIVYDLATNGMLLSPPILKELLPLGPSDIFVSIQSPSEEHFSHRNRKISFEFYIDCLRTLIQVFLKVVEEENIATLLKLKFLYQNTKNYFPNVPFINSVHDFPEFIFFLKQLLPKHIDIGKQSFLGEYPPSQEVHINSHISICFDEVGCWADWPTKSKPDPSENRQCPQDKTLGILCDGRYVLCCLDYNGETAFSDIDSVSLVEVLSNFKRQTYMQNSLCSRCLA